LNDFWDQLLRFQVNNTLEINKNFNFLTITAYFNRNRAISNDSMATPGTESGPPPSGLPPEQLQALTDHVVNGSADNRKSRDRLKSSKVNEDGGEVSG
jgi:hypothetical protein